MLIIIYHVLIVSRYVFYYKFKQLALDANVLRELYWLNIFVFLCIGSEHEWNIRGLNTKMSPLHKGTFKWYSGKTK